MEGTVTRLDAIGSELISLLGDPAVGSSDGELLTLTRSVAWLGRIVAAAETRLAGEVGARSRPSLGDEGLSRSQNFTSPATFLAAVTGLSSREAKSRLELGVRLRGADLLGGGVGPSPYPLVCAALANGSMGVGCAEVITRECTVLARRGVDPAALSSAEAHLVDAVTDPALTADDVTGLAIRIRELLDPDGLEPRADAQHEARSLTLSRAADGMYRGRLALTPEAGAVWLGALHELISPRTPVRFASEDDYVEHAVTADTRTSAQKMADAATELITRAAGSPEQPHLAGATTTVHVHVHVTVADLAAGHGVGWVDGLDEPVPSSTIERLRCTSPTVATVFGDRGEILHHGKTRRLFTPAQNRALAARDGGCVWLGCDRPPSWCETHHVAEWKSPDYRPGRTDIDNGVLLCHFHHSHLHKSSWRLVMQNGVPHLVPPREIDVEQKPIRVTRRRTLPARLSSANAPDG